MYYYCCFVVVVIAIVVVLLTNSFVEDTLNPLYEPIFFLNNSDPLKKIASHAHNIKQMWFVYEAPYYMNFIFNILYSKCVTHNMLQQKDI